jgi:hypothetical protein
MRREHETNGVSYSLLHNIMKDSKFHDSDMTRWIMQGRLFCEIGKSRDELYEPLKDEVSHYIDAYNATLLVLHATPMLTTTQVQAI